MSALLRQMMADSPAGLWPLDESSGTTAFDRSGNGRNLSTEGGLSLGGGTLPVLGKGILGDGTDDAVGRADNCGMTATGVTLAAWVNRAAGGNKGAVIRIGSNGTGYAMGVSDGTGSMSISGDKLVGVYEGIRWITPNITVAAGLRYLVMTIDGSGTATFFVDGVSAGSSTGGAPNTPGANTHVGGYTESGVYFRHSNADIAYAAAYPTVLSNDRITAHYQAGVRGGVVGG